MTLPALLAGVLAALLGGCDESFEPIVPGSLQFSVYGYLDASADTQWIRVTPVRPVAVTSPDSFEATVTVEHLGTGRVIALRDSVFRLIHWRDPEIGSEGSYVHNFWTTEPIEPGAVYRFSAERDGQEPAEAVVEVPEEYEVEVWIAQLPGEPDYLHLVGLEHLAFVGMIVHFSDMCRPSVVVDTGAIRYDGGPATDEVHMVSIPGLGITVPDGVCANLRVMKARLWIVGSGREWPSGGHAPRELVPERASNITNSVGFLGGVLTRVVPYERCELQGTEGGPAQEHCRLRYDEEAAGLTGRLTETRCNDGPIDSVTVELRELDGEPAAMGRIRTTMSSPAGTYEIQALRPGIRHALKARAQPVPDPFWGEIDDYTLHHDTVVFAPGEEPEYDIGLERLTDCSLGP